MLTPLQRTQMTARERVAPTPMERIGPSPYTYHQQREQVRLGDIHRTHVETNRRESLYTPFGPPNKFRF